jgi:hypothetical protein
MRCKLTLHIRTSQFGVQLELTVLAVNRNKYWLYRLMISFSSSWLACPLTWMGGEEPSS